MLQMVYPSTGLASQNAEHSSVPHLSKIICTELEICIEMLPQNATHHFRSTGFMNGGSYSVNNISLSRPFYL